MTGDLTYTSRWWAWWSNPAIHIHEEQGTLLGLTAEQMNRIDYFDLIQLRSSLNLPDLPDDLLIARPELRSLAFQNDQAMESQLLQFGMFTLDSSILHARPQDWESSFGVTSPELIRQIITLKNELPGQLAAWHDATARHMANALKKKLLLTERIRLGLAVYLRSHFPRFYSRWQLTQSKEIVGWANALEPMPPELWEVVDPWSAHAIQAFHQDIYSPFEIIEFELSLDDDQQDNNA